MKIFKAIICFLFHHEGVAHTNHGSIITCLKCGREI